MNENNVNLALVDDEELSISELDFEVTKEKSFNECFNCEYFRKGCSGPNLCGTSTERACEFLQLCRLQLGYSYQKTADLSGLSLVTVKRTLTGKNKDPGLATINALSAVLVSDPKGKYPCALHIVNEESEKLAKECQRLQAELDGINAKHKQKVESLHAKYQEDIRFLKEQISFKENQMLAKDKVLGDDYDFIRRKNRIIAALSFALAITVFIIIAALAVDNANPNIGFFWLEETVATIFGHGGLATNGFDQTLNVRL